MRSDLIVEFNDNVYLVIETKYLKSTETNKEKIITKMNELADKALQQITEKNYSGPYLSCASELIEVGLAVTAKGLSLANICIRKINNIS
jgi:hypothetical protein